MKIQVRNLKNEKVREIELSESVFGFPYREHLIHLAVEAIRAGQRRGTHKAKGRGEVSGSGRKLWRQKGTGRARVGSIRSPLWRSGGIVHGPKPRTYEKKLSAREKRNALRSALSRKLETDGIVVLDSLELESHRTAELARALAGLGLAGKMLLVDQWDNETLVLAARNNPNLKTVDALGVNVYDVVDRAHVVLSERSLDRLTEVLAS
jgi:large subunit ribosomal protein L4